VRTTKKIVFTALVLMMMIFAGLRILAGEVIFYPIWANNVSASTSLKKEIIHLYSGGVTNGVYKRKFVDGERSEAELSIQRAYITWAPYLDGEDKDGVSVDAALPDLEPNTILKSRVMKELGADNRKSVPDDVHRQWVKIDIGLYGFFNALCDSPCSREEHSRKSTENILKDYPIRKTDSESLGLKHMISNSQKYFMISDEVYTPINTEVSVKYIRCKAVSDKFNWCEASARLNNDMYLRYQFEKSYLSEWLEIDKKVRYLANSFVVSHSVYKE